MEQHLSEHSVPNFALYKAMQDWHNRVSDFLAYVNDVLHPRRIFSPGKRKTRPTSCRTGFLQTNSA